MATQHSKARQKAEARQTPRWEKSSITTMSTRSDVIMVPFKIDLAPEERQRRERNLADIVCTVLDAQECGITDQYGLIQVLLAQYESLFPCP